jgi:hypothetical protein
MSHIDRLATVSKILQDERVIELRQEVETLKLGIFWRDNSLFRLNEAMKIANAMHVKCWCSFCDLKGPNDMIEEARPLNFTGECRFMPWFHEVLLSHGLVMLEASWPERMGGSHIVPRSSGPLTKNDCMDVDCHLFQLGSESSYAFGTKLWKAKNVNDPELQKLTKLISVLEAYY